MTKKTKTNAPLPFATLRNVRGRRDVRTTNLKETSTTKMAIILKNNDTGFIIQTESEEQYYAKPTHLQGTCIMENCIRIGEFWRKGWTETTMFLSLIKTLDGRLITHANILNPKNRQFIDVSNGLIKMIDTDIWFKSNKVIAWGILNYDDALKVKKINGIDYNAINDKEMMGLRCRCNDVFEKLMEFKDQRQDKKKCNHKWECGCDKDYCDGCKEYAEETGEEYDTMCEDEKCKAYYESRNDNCDCGTMECPYCN